MSQSGTQSAEESVAPLNHRHRRARKEPIDDVVEVSFEMMHSVPARAGELVNSHQRWAQVVIKPSPPRVSGIPEGEVEGAPCSLGSLRLANFGFLVGEAVPDLSSEDDEIDEVYCSSKFQDYLVNNPYQAAPKPSRERQESTFKAKDVESVVTKAGLFVYRGQFKVQ